MSRAAFIQVQTYRSDCERKPYDGKRLVVSPPSNAVVVLVLKEHSIDDLLDGGRHVYTGMFIKQFTTVLLTLVSKDSRGLSSKYHMLGI